MPEQQNIEYKQSWHDDYLKWVCGFANAQGGQIYIGKDRRPPTKSFCLQAG
jgi:ATP-dependent DNA helicase RecG